ncbi:MAG TPA: lytic transglycosylase domain-containing protein, partial [Alphaproteobacteria bacterium]|nr:lytic transglycosylase domain-containing protein [Alphaproteobacteria bacterium]
MTTFRSAAAIAALAMTLGGGAAPGQDVAAEERVAALSGTVVALDRVARLPAVLGGLDRARYRGIFALQQGGAWEDADALIEALDNTVLMGHVLFQRYMHPTKYRSSYAELAG